MIGAGSLRGNAWETSHDGILLTLVLDGCLTPLKPIDWSGFEPLADRVLSEAASLDLSVQWFRSP